MEDKLDLKLLLYLVKKRWYLIFAGILLFLFIAYLLNTYTTPTYEVSLSIIIDEKGKDLTGLKEFLTENFLKSSKDLEVEAEVIKSHYLIRETIDSLSLEVSYFLLNGYSEKEICFVKSPYIINIDKTSPLYLNIPFYIEPVDNDSCRIRVNGENVSIYDSYMDIILRNKLEALLYDVKIPLNKKIQINGMILSVKKNDTENLLPESDTTFYFTLNDPNELTISYFNKISVEPGNLEASILMLSIKGKTPEKDALFLNKLANIYIKNQYLEKDTVAFNTINFIDRQLKEISDYLVAIEDSMDFFLTANKIIDFELTIAGLYEKKKNLEFYEMDLIKQLNQYKQLKDNILISHVLNDTLIPVATGINNDQLLLNLISEYNALVNISRDKIFYGTKENPMVKKSEGLLEHTKQKIIEYLENASIDKQNKIDAVRYNINEIFSELKGLVTLFREYNRMARTFEFLETNYNYLNTKKIEALITMSSLSQESENAKILNKAYANYLEPEFPKKRLNYTIAIIAGLIISSYVIFSLYTYNLKILSKEDIKNITDIPIAGIVSQSKNHVKKYHNIESVDRNVFESFYQIKANLKYFAKGDNFRVITITSTIEGEGKSFNAFHLSMAYALSGKKTVLIEADMRKPKLKTFINSTKNIGLSNYLINEYKEEEIVQKGNVPNLSVVLAGPIPPNPYELLEGGEIGKLIAYLRENFEYVLIDTPPMGLAADFISLIDFTDICLYIVRQNYTKPKMLSDINEMYKGNRIKQVNIILNDYSPKLDNVYGYSGGYYSDK